jgi:hypothetical protein
MCVCVREGERERERERRAERERESRFFQGPSRLVEAQRAEIVAAGIVAADHYGGLPRLGEVAIEIYPSTYPHIWAAHTL